MELQFNSIADMVLTLNTEEKAITFFEQMRWKGQITCPHCGHGKVYRTNVGFKCASPACYKKFTVKVGTVFEGSNIKLQKWFMAIYIFTAHKKGVSSCQLARDLNVSQKTAWFMLHRIREMFMEKAPHLIKGEIQIDETYIGGKRRNKSKAKRAEALKVGYEEMTPVIGMLEKGGKLILKATGGNSVDKSILHPIILENIEPQSTIVTDGFGGYRGLNNIYKHEIINHEKNEFKAGKFHTNSIEGAFGLMKRGIYGIYHQISPKHLQSYCNEFAYRYNSRTIVDAFRFAISLTHTQGRLTYNQLIAR